MDTVRSPTLASIALETLSLAALFPNITALSRVSLSYAYTVRLTRTLSAGAAHLPLAGRDLVRLRHSGFCMACDSLFTLLFTFYLVQQSSLQFLSHSLFQLLLEVSEEPPAPSSGGLSASAEPTGRVPRRVLGRGLLYCLDVMKTLFSLSIIQAFLITLMENIIKAFEGIVTLFNETEAFH